MDLSSSTIYLGITATPFSHSQFSAASCFLYCFRWSLLLFLNSDMIMMMWILLFVIRLLYLVIVDPFNSQMTRSLEAKLIVLLCVVYISSKLLLWEMENSGAAKFQIFLPNCFRFFFSVYGFKFVFNMHIILFCVCFFSSIEAENEVLLAI